jgi:ABC-2 type transport system ATP-binding protein
MNQKIAISMRGVAIRSGKTRVIHGLDQDIPAGSVTALVGENGAGKSTLLDAVLGLVRPVAGRLTVLGMDPVKDGVRVRSKIGYLESEPALDPDDTVATTLDLHRGVRESWDERIAEAWLNRLHLPSRRRVRALSRGERAKLALVLAMAPNPDLLLLDEPFDGLDLGSRDAVERAIFDQIEGSKKTVLLASHDIGEIERLADRVGVLVSGRMCAFGSPDDVRRKVARFSVPRQCSALFEGSDLNVHMQTIGDDRIVTCAAASAVAARLLDADGVAPLPVPPLREAVRHLARADAEVSS